MDVFSRSRSFHRAGHSYKVRLGPAASRGARSPLRAKDQLDVIIGPARGTEIVEPDGHRLSTATRRHLPAVARRMPFCATAPFPSSPVINAASEMAVLQLMESSVLLHRTGQR